MDYIQKMIDMLDRLDEDVDIAREQASFERMVEQKLPSSDIVKFFEGISKAPSLSMEFKHILPPITRVIFNNPATIVFWEDGEKTIVQAQNGELFDREKGLAMAIVKRVYENKSSYNDIFKKWIGEENTYETGCIKLETQSTDAVLEPALQQLLKSNETQRRCPKG